MTLYAIYVTDPTDIEDKNNWTYIGCTTQVDKIQEIEKKYAEEELGIEYDEENFATEDFELPVDELKRFYNWK